MKIEMANAAVIITDNYGQKFRILEEAGSITVELSSLEDFEAGEYKYICTFHFEDKKALDLFYQSALKTLELSDYED